MISNLSSDDIQGLLNAIDHPVTAKINEIIQRSNQADNMECMRWVDGSRTDLYIEEGTRARPYKTIQAAIDSITTATAMSPHVVVVAPGLYEENVVLKRHIKLTDYANFGPSGTTRIRSASGHTLSIPPFDATVNGLWVTSTSIVPTDSAVRFVDDGLGAGTYQTFILNVDAMTTGASRAVSVEAAGAQLIMIYAGVDPGPGSEGIVIDGSALIWFLGGGGDRSERGVKIINGGLGLFGASVGISASNISPTAWALEVDGGVAFVINATLSAMNGLLVQGGGFAILGKAQALGGFAGIPVQTAPGTVIAIGNAYLDNPGSPPLGAWVLGGAAMLLGSGRSGYGTAGIGGPDQRPTTPPATFMFFALDLLPGGGAGSGSWLTWNGIAWIDSTGAAIP